MESLAKIFEIEKNVKISISDFDPGYSVQYNKDEAEGILNDLKKKLQDLQERLYVTKKYSLLLIFQAMGAAGKDSAIDHVMGGVDPQGCSVHSFKQPSHEELAHDFLWRHAKALPERGIIGIHNRSHYENVLVTKVHPALVENEFISGDDINKDFWKDRYESIRDFEKHLTRNGTVILKFFLNVSKKEQKKRFLDRINEPDKNWKFSTGDLEERKHWDEYMEAYESAIMETTRDYAPWYIIPADKKWFARIAIISIIIDRLKKLDLEYPSISKAEKEILLECKEQLLNES